MSRKEDELERLKRLRERQLADRDPRARDRALYQKVSALRQSKKLTLKNVLADLQAKWLWMFVGGVIGAIAALVIVLVFQAKWAEYVGYAIIAFGIVVGRLLGAVRDWGDEDWGRK
jgi:hypothetical protein